jgi:hypothetical protein
MKVNFIMIRIIIAKKKKKGASKIKRIAEIKKIKREKKRKGGKQGDKYKSEENMDEGGLNIKGVVILHIK